MTLLQSEHDALPADVSIEFQGGPRLASLLRGPYHVRYARTIDNGVSPQLLVRVCDRGRLYNVHYAEGIDFTFDLNGTRLWVRWNARANPEHVQSYLLGPVMGLLLRVRNVVCLHASAVNLHGRAVVFIGPAHAGKSTTAMAFGRRGYPILSDDIVPLYRTVGGFFAGSGYPTVRLRTSALAPLGRLTSALPDLPVAAGPARLHFRLNGGYRFQAEPIPIDRIYALRSRERNERAPRVREMARLDGLMALVANSYATGFLDQVMRRDEMTWFAELTEQVPIFELVSHADGGRLEQYCDLIAGAHNELAG